jgi:hypothetical protein
VDSRARATPSSGEPCSMASPGAAMWMPMREPMPGSLTTESASSISVVWASSIEKAGTSARGRSLGQFGASSAGKAGAFRELLVQETTVVQVVGRLDGAALEQQLRRRQAGFTQAVSKALVSGLLRSGA